MITVSELHELLTADFEAGRLFWRNAARSTNGRGHDAGDEAGYMEPRGYFYLDTGKGRYAVHRILWAMYHGDWPTKEIDHIDRNKSNNAIANLRDVSSRENEANKERKGNLPLGVHRKNKRFEARLYANGSRSYLGTYGTPEEASAAYQKALEAALGQGKENG